MQKTLITLSLIAATATAAFAADDPIAVRKSLMQANGAAAGLSAGMMKKEIDYSPAAGKAAIAAQAELKTKSLLEGLESNAFSKVSLFQVDASEAYAKSYASERPAARDGVSA